ncbi:two-component sensor histidine kinase [Nonomuraea aridisoli]|uniref:histidine kinase n=1 Tax=Nonomuraea aridisoli TaxID=2070368 RepID=A0A2W2EL44_9ACTN|nr:histidine kinase [Nonomuraea aridisoli]PZG23103.1 two-component sensor histidine kinase [Nonomuraea aridisoli]
MSEVRVLARPRRWANALPPIWVDSALAAAVLVAQLWPLLSRDNPHGGPWHWWGYVSVIAATAPLVWRRRSPALVLVTSLLLGESYDLVDEVAAQPIWYAGLVALYTAAAYSGRVTRVALLTVTLGGGLLMVGSWETAMRGIVLFVAAYAIGRAAAASRARAAALEERAARIARDMHDILAHAVSVMVVQAEAGPLAVERDPARAVAAFDAIAAAGRDAMEQLRRMLNVLKEEEGPRGPQPTIAALPALAEQIRATGLDVTYSTAGEPRPMSPDAEVAAYRITQEALTNVVKHAGAGRAGIALTWRERELMIDITDDGRGRGPGLPSGGNGLIGIRERAAACGGPTPGRAAAGAAGRAHRPANARRCGSSRAACPTPRSRGSWWSASTP